MDIVRIDKLTNERWLNLYGVTFRHNDHTGRWVYASRKDPDKRTNKADAVVIVPILRMPDQPAQLLMLREYRIPIAGYNHGLPAGLFEEGEDIETTIRRELLEETGYELARIKKISPAVYSSTGMTDESAIMAFVDVTQPVDCKQCLEASEMIEPILLDFAQVCNLCEQREVVIDAKAWLVLYMYQQLGQLV